MRLVVIGGGISGTAAAFTARKTAVALGLNLEVVLLERESEVGGKARSQREDDWLFETGPIGYLNDEPVVEELVRDSGLGSELLTAGEAQSHRFVYSRGRVREVESSPLGFATGGLLGLPGLLRAACEPFIPAKTDDAEESVWDFAERRLGAEFASRLVQPMVLGIFSGDAKRLSLPAAFPLMAELEREHGSLVRAQIARARARKRGELPPLRSTLRSFPEGIQALPRALAARGGFTVRTRTVVDKVARRTGGGWLVSLENEREPIEADAVILACEGYRAASILSETLPEVSRRLAGIPQPPVGVVALGYGSDALGDIPDGFGVLIPREAGFRSLGVTFDGRLFPGRSREGHLLIRILFGGSFDPEVHQVDPGELVETAKKEMAALFRLTAPPLFSRAKLWERAIPQYEMGHVSSRRLVEEELRAAPGLYLAGNALYGVAFGKAAARGAACGKEAVESLRPSLAG